MSDATLPDARVRYGADRAAAWSKWFHVIEAGAQPLCDRMVELANIVPGTRVVDIATGLGEPAVTAARRAGPDGRVLAIDLSADMLSLARARTDAEGLQNVAFREMDANALDLPKRAFDAVLSRWGLMFIPDLARALRRMRACLAPGGRLVAAVWGPPETAPAVSLSDRIVRAALGLPSPKEGAMSPFALADTTAFTAAVMAAGFRSVTGEWLDVVYVFDDAETFTQFRHDRSGPLLDEIANYSDVERETAWARVTEAAREYAGPDGRIRMRNRAYCLRAET